MYRHELAVRTKRYIQPLSGNQSYPVLVNDTAKASHDNPARRSGSDEKRYPAEVEGGQGPDVKRLSDDTFALRKLSVTKKLCKSIPFHR
jgi:hypothetical protein